MTRHDDIDALYTALAKALNNRPHRSIEEVVDAVEEALQVDDLVTRVRESVRTALNKQADEPEEPKPVQVHNSVAGNVSRTLHAIPTMLLKPGDVIVGYRHHSDPSYFTLYSTPLQVRKASYDPSSHTWIVSTATDGNWRYDNHQVVLVRSYPSEQD